MYAHWHKAIWIYDTEMTYFVVRKISNFRAPLYWYLTYLPTKISINSYINVTQKNLDRISTDNQVAKTCALQVVGMRWSRQSKSIEYTCIWLPNKSLMISELY